MSPIVNDGLSLKLEGHTLPQAGPPEAPRQPEMIRPTCEATLGRTLSVCGKPAGFVISAPGVQLIACGIHRKAYRPWTQWRIAVNPVSHEAAQQSAQGIQP